MLRLKVHITFHFGEYLKLQVDGPLVSATESAPKSTLKLHLRMPKAIETLKNKKVHLRLQLRVHLRLHLSCDCIVLVGTHSNAQTYTK